MNRIRRWLFTGFAALMSLLFVVTVAMWVRSYWATDVFIFEGNHIVGNQEKMTGVQLWSTRDELEFSIIKGEGQPVPSAEMSWLRHLVYPPTQQRWIGDERSFLLRHGLFVSGGPSDNGFVNSVRASRSLGISLKSPYWFLVIGLSIYPVWQIFRLGKRRKWDGRLCVVCGYDLRATPDRCPECGTIPPKR
jgi:hypothetical protein